MPSSMQMSRTLAPFSTCWRAMLTASSYFPSLISLANFGEPATLVRSPITMYTPCCCVKGWDPERRRGLKLVEEATVSLSGKLGLLFHGLDLPRRQAFHRFRDGRDVFRRVAATAARNIDQPCLRKLSQVTRHVRRTEVET